MVLTWNHVVVLAVFIWLVYFVFSPIAYFFAKCINDYVYVSRIEYTVKNAIKIQNASKNIVSHQDKQIILRTLKQEAYHYRSKIFFAYVDPVAIDHLDVNNLVVSSSFFSVF